MDEAEKDRLRELIKGKHIEPAEMTAERKAEVSRLIAGYAAQLKITQTGPNDYAISAGDLETDLRTVPRGEKQEIIFVGSLTKSVFMLFPEEAYLMSNVCHEDGRRIFGGVVGSMAEREQLWRRLRAMHLTGRTFYVFQDEEAGHAHESKMIEMRALAAAQRERA